MTTYNKIRQWAHDRNLIEGSTPARQFKKLMEEFGELGCAVMEKNETDIKDAIGDIAVVLTIIAAQYGVKLECETSWMNFDGDIETVGEQLSYLTYLSDPIYQSKTQEYLADAKLALCGFTESIGYDFDECLELAYNQIKDRKGRMVEGVFVKE